ncbi:putative protein S-acyltransferase [Dioscorea sansibarensis]
MLVCVSANSFIATIEGNCFLFHWELLPCNLLIEQSSVLFLRVFALSSCIDAARACKYVYNNCDICFHDIHGFCNVICFQNGQLRFCMKCFHYKPPRAHHCSICDKCILRMDHHCIWLSNCVGHGNYKIFFLVVMYAVTSCGHATILLIYAARDVFKTQQQTGEAFKISHVSLFFVFLSNLQSTSLCTNHLLARQIACGALLFPLTFVLTMLFLWHIYLALYNMTTVEHLQGVRGICPVDKVADAYRHPYDLGVYENCSSLFGRNAACWMCPTELDNGSGFHFRTTLDDTNSAASSSMYVAR